MAQQSSAPNKERLLVVIASAIAHDVYFKTLRPNASQKSRVFVGKTMILVGAALAALPNLALIAQMVAWAFSLAAASFFPIILLGIFWKRANGPGEIAGIIGGFTVTIFYMAMNYVDPAFNLFGIAHTAAGIFGIPVNFALTIIVSLLTPAPVRPAWPDPGPHQQCICRSKFEPIDQLYHGQHMNRCTYCQHLHSRRHPWSATTVGIPAPSSTSRRIRRLWSALLCRSRRRGATQC